MDREQTALCQEENRILFENDDSVLVGSRFGPLAKFQLALSDALQRCGKRPVPVDGIIGERTRAGIVEMAQCSLMNSPPGPQHGAITVGLWRSLLPGTPLPTVLDRSFILWLSHEGTDYDRIEWNYGTSDDLSAVTWGPYGATAGYGNEVRGIIAKLISDDKSLILSSFGAEYPVLDKLVTQSEESGYSTLKPVFTDPVRRQKWQEIFQEMGKHQEVRDAYDWYAFRSDRWLRPPVRRLYGLLANQSPGPSEVDFAFFVDLAMHMSISQARVERARAALLLAEHEHPLTPAQRRQVISRVLIPTNQKADRLGRDVVYYVDGVGIAGLSAEERAAWLARTGRKASQCGLSDSRQFSPNFLGPDN